MTIQTPRLVPRALPPALVLLFVLSLAFLNYGNYQAGTAPWEMVVNAILLSIPLGMFYFSVGLLVAAARQWRSQAQFGRRLASMLYWTPRIAGLLITLFVGIFALDVFGEGYSFWDLIVGLFMHLIPSFVLALILVLAWRWEWIGFVAYMAAAAFFMVLAFRDLIQGLGILLIFICPIVVIALLFGANWRWRTELRQARAARV